MRTMRRSPSRPELSSAQVRAGHQLVLVLLPWALTGAVVVLVPGWPVFRETAEAMLPALPASVLAELLAEAAEIARQAAGTACDS